VCTKDESRVPKRGEDFARTRFTAGKQKEKELQRWSARISHAKHSGTSEHLPTALVTLLALIDQENVENTLNCLKCFNETADACMIFRKSRRMTIA
jgi:hypothetical protein